MQNKPTKVPPRTNRYVFPLSVSWQECTQNSPVMNYNSGSFHGGWDISPAPGVGANVLASVGGTVIRKKELTDSYGSHIMIQGADGYFHIYAHMQRGSITVNIGQQVTAGTILGVMGETGNAYGKHLHYEVRPTENGHTSALNAANLLGFVDRVGPITLSADGGAVNMTGTMPNGDSGTLGDNSAIAYQEPSAYVTAYEMVEGTEEPGEVLYGRRYRIMITDDNGIGVDVSDLHVTFELFKNYLGDIQYSVINVYNVNRNTENFIIANGAHVYVEAGYEGDYYGHIFTGDIVQAYGFNENGTDFVLEIVAADGERFLSEGFVNFSFLRGMTQRKQAESIISNATVKTELKSIGEGFEESSLPRGKAYFGMAKDYLNQIAKNTNTNLFCEDGTVNLVSITDIAKDRIFNLNPKTGLIGVPQQEDKGISGKCLLIPQIRVGSRIRVENQYVKQKRITVGSAASVSELGNAGVGAGGGGNYSNGFRDFIKSYEGLSLVAYKPVASEEYWTIGWGHYGPDVQPGMVITEAQAEAFLTQDLDEAASYVDSTTYCPFTVTLSPCEREALISFAMNLGQGGLQQLCRGRTKEDIPDHILSYNKGADGSVLEGLTRRRRSELEAFQTGQCVKDNVTYIFSGGGGATPYVGVVDTGTTTDSGMEYTGVNPMDEFGIYIVASVKYSGDTRGDNWYIEFEGYRQTMAIPESLIDYGGLTREGEEAEETDGE